MYIREGRMTVEDFSSRLVLDFLSRINDWQVATKAL